MLGTNSTFFRKFIPLRRPCKVATSLIKEPVKIIRENAKRIAPAPESDNLSELKR